MEELYNSLSQYGRIEYLIISIFMIFVILFFVLGFPKDDAASLEIPHLDKARNLDKNKQNKI